MIVSVLIKFLFRHASCQMVNELFVFAQSSPGLRHAINDVVFFALEMAFEKQTISRFELDKFIYIMSVKQSKDALPLKKSHPTHNFWRVPHSTDVTKAVSCNFRGPAADMLTFNGTRFFELLNISLNGTKRKASF